MEKIKFRAFLVLIFSKNHNVDTFFYIFSSEKFLACAEVLG